jgi:copper(I)-binding protein
MSKRHWIAGAVAIAGIGAVGLLFWPTIVPERSNAHVTHTPSFQSLVAVRDARVALPVEAADPAEVFFTITNRGEDQTLFVTGIELAGASVLIADPAGPVTTKMGNVAIQPGATVTFSPDGPHGLLPNYNSDVVPGAVLDLKITFGTSGTVSVPADVTILRNPRDASAIVSGKGKNR